MSEKFNLDKFEAKYLEPNPWPKKIAETLGGFAESIKSIAGGSRDKAKAALDRRSEAKAAKKAEKAETATEKTAPEKPGRESEPVKKPKAKKPAPKKTEKAESKSHEEYIEILKGTLGKNETIKAGFNAVRIHMELARLSKKDPELADEICKKHGLDTKMLENIGSTSFTEAAESAEKAGRQFYYDILGFRENPPADEMALNKALKEAIDKIYTHKNLIEKVKADGDEILQEILKKKG